MKIGDKLPSFSLPDENGDLVGTEQLAGRHILIIFFYPKDDTPGCTREVCSFRDEHEEFVKAGARVIGISSDSSERHRAFKNKHGLPFTLLSDEQGAVRKLFEVPSGFLGMIPGRVTYIIDETGTVRGIFSSQMKPARHIKEALKTIRQIKEEGN